MLRGARERTCREFRPDSPTDDIVPAITPRGMGTFSEKPAFFAEMKLTGAGLDDLAASY